MNTVVCPVCSDDHEIMGIVTSEGVFEGAREIDCPKLTSTAIISSGDVIVRGTKGSRDAG